ncbi:Copper resistance protein D [Marinomonas spartinae]|uniref:Copper resistance protein D n=1 Tax=Marinomonas spartinae TaxID=1792290 RepID=A0A1A8TNB6_9GAMM|nr:copper homeostasis membrane protein CopD [Marinomonas spartinae]SBS34141.1 Copper resistance protein D [Marinomonas spartinae]
MDLTVHLALVTNRFLLESVGSLFWGMLFYPILFLQKEVAQTLLVSISKFITPCVWVLFVCVLLTLPINVAMIGDGWSDVFSGSLWWPVVTETSAGLAWQISLIGGCILLLSNFFASNSKMVQKYKMFLLLLGGGLILVSFSFTGHAQMNEGWRGVVHQLSDILHVFAGASWVGGLFALYFVFKVLSDTENSLFLIKAVQRFSRLGMVSVSIIVCSGMINTLLILGHLPFGLQNTYQAMLTGKILLVALMIGLAIRNRVVLAPMLGQSALRQGGIASLKKAIMLELGFGILVILAVAIFGVLDPHAGDF